MNDQVVVLLRYALAALVPLGVAKGWFTPEQASDLVTNIINFIGAAVPLAMAAWALVRSTKTAKVADVQAMPDMQVATSNKAVAEAVPEVKLVAEGAKTVTVPAPKPA